MNTGILLARWAAPVLVTGLLVTGCGGSGGSAGGQGSTQAAGRGAFQHCLRQHGVNVPTARPSFAGTPSPGQFGGGGQFPGGQGGTGSSAFQACRKYLPAGFGPGGGGGAGISSSAFSAFRSCLQQHGVKLTGTGPTALRSLRNAAGKTAKAVRTCQPLLPTGIPTPSSG